MFAQNIFGNKIHTIEVHKSAQKYVKVITPNSKYLGAPQIFGNEIDLEAQQSTWKYIKVPKSTPKYLHRSTS